MKNSNDRAKGLNDLLKKLPAADPPDLPEADDASAVLVFSFLLWESSTDKAVAAYRRLLDNSVDFNDLRVSMPHEIIDAIGVRYPRAEERAHRLRATLRDIYLREHDVSLQRISSEPKREIRKYIESLEGIVPYVVGRVMLMGYDAHAIPVDEQLRQSLIDAGIADTDMDIADLSSWMARQIKAGDSVQAHLALQAWLDSGEARAGRKGKSSARSGRGGSRRDGGRGKKSTSSSRSSSRTKAAGSGAS